MEGRLHPAAELGDRRHLERVFTALLAQADTEGDLEWVVSVDSTLCWVSSASSLATSRIESPVPPRS
ncbi:hypothetical protein [Streptomyces sp. NPDC004579]|uniref:hypothetical protein n=1 Tax=Streptomyces sp. NPDC004579 TaxID=3154667 RepID=UPI0033AEF917